MSRVIIAGAGLAGLACAVRLAKAGVNVSLVEAAPQAGGRCRSFHEKSLDTTIDNGNHLLLSGNTAALGFLKEVGAEDRLIGPPGAAFPFADLASGERWTVMPNRGYLPWWILHPGRRVAGTTPMDYLSVARMLKSRHGALFTDVVQPRGILYERFWDPFIVAVLNVLPGEAAAELITPVLWQTFGRGAAACRPLVARLGLSDTFVEPALTYLKEHGSTVAFGCRAADVTFDHGRISSLQCGTEKIDLGPDDQLVLAVPAPVAQDMVPGLEAPTAYSSIVNLHFKVPAGPRLDSPFIGLVNGLAQWLFVRDGIASVTISAAGNVADRPGDEIALQVWREIAPIMDLPLDPLPPNRVIKERRATFRQSPDQVARRPGARTSFANLFLAGDWTDTGIPATIEGAIRSGNTAADAVLNALEPER